MNLPAGLFAGWEFIQERSSELALRTSEHLALTGMSLGLAMAIGMVVSVAGALGKTSGPKWLVRIIDEYIELIRNTPFLIQIFVIYFGLPTFGLKFSSIVLDYAGGSLLVTALYTALIVWIVGLAVPVTASYIICAVIAAPALIKLGVPDYAAHMFIFYYAVLSEVSPPTALSPFAAAAITGGDPYKTTLQAWKYTLPAFLVPFVFVLDPLGIGLLMNIPKGGSWLDVVWITAITAAGLGALSVAAQSWALRHTTPVERFLFLISGLLLVFPSLLEALLELITGLDIPHPAPFGLVLGAALLLWQWQRPRPSAASA